MTAVSTRARVRVRVSGTVQGVGFRPFVYRLARELGIGGFVLNDAWGVLVEAEGEGGAVTELLRRLQQEAPPLAVVETVHSEPLTPLGEHEFQIAPSPRSDPANAPVTPDCATCPDCLGELGDPADRRFAYPFINCTNCGPRFTIVTSVPYDRPYTTMAAFTMCERCRAEYEDPGDRRFHAQPNACPDCGPRLRVRGPGGAVVPKADRAPIPFLAESLRGGSIAAVKGLGGFHLACLAADESAVARLRARKHRADKPFALMAGSLAAAERLVELSDPGREALLSPARPIVLAPRRAGAPVAQAVAPAATELGVMLPYTPLHHLLLEAVGATLVLTSGNVSDEPIAFRDTDALERLSGIADLFLLHDRPIHTRTDDSVVRALARPEPRLTTLRRSRGYVPTSLPLPGAGTPRPLLSCGAQLKNTFCMAKGERAWISHHIGDLENYETLCSFTEGVEHFRRLFAVDPEVVVHDLHPEYLSTKFALDQPAAERIGVQHHHAHLAACLAEHREPGPAVGAIFDGSGYGTDGTIWGGELLVGDAGGFERVGHLPPVRLPGGEGAIREPWRMACAWLTATVGDPVLPPTLAGSVSGREWAAVRELIQRGIASPLTTSMGRLFDAVAALCGVCPRVSYEGQAAIELEAACDPRARGRYQFDRLDPRVVVAEAVQDLEAGTPVPTVAMRFHRAVAQATAEACAAAAADHGIEVVVLSGGVFQNRILLQETLGLLGGLGLRALTPERLPAGDGGIAYGQAVVAARRLREAT